MTHPAGAALLADEALNVSPDPVGELALGVTAALEDAGDDAVKRGDIIVVTVPANTGHRVIDAIRTAARG